MRTALLLAAMGMGGNWVRGDAVLDFDDAAQLQMLQEPGGEHVRYTHSAQAGAGGKPGMLLSANTGKQDTPLFYARESFDLRRQTVKLTVLFKAGTENGEGACRVFAGLADHLDANVSAGDAKIGARLFKPNKSKTPAKPWTLQLINGIATRDLGGGFALSEGCWYQLRVELGLSDDNTQIVFDVGLQDLGASGDKPGELKRGEHGTTQVLGSYNLQTMRAALLGQNNHGGAVALDDWKIGAVERTVAATAPATQAARDVRFAPPPPLPADRRVPPQTIFGVCGHFMHTPLFYRDGKSNTSPYWQLEYTLPPLVEANLGWVREPLYQPWFDDDSKPRVLENRQTVERYLAMYGEHGVKVVLAPMAVGPGDKQAAQREPFFRWLGSLCKRFECVRVVEMHNEPNLGFFWKGTAADYVSTYRRAAEIIHQEKPGVSIAVGSVSSLWFGPGVEWLKQVLDGGALEWADAISVHPYNKKIWPEGDPHFEGANDDPGHLEKAIDAFYALVKSKAPPGRAPKLYFTELGYSSGREGMAALGDEQQQADYLSRLMLIYFGARLRGVPLEGVFWYDFKNDGQSDHAESNFGLLGFDGSVRKPAYEYYRRIATFFADPGKFQPLDTKAEWSNFPEATKCYTWRRDDGALIVAAWRLDQRLPNSDFATELTLPLPEGFEAGEVRLHSLSEQQPRAIGYGKEQRKLVVPLRLSCRAAWLEISPARVSNGR